MRGDAPPTTRCPLAPAGWCGHVECADCSYFIAEHGNDSQFICITCLGDTKHTEIKLLPFHTDGLCPICDTYSPVLVGMKWLPKSVSSVE